MQYIFFIIFSLPLFLSGCISVPSSTHQQYTPPVTITEQAVWRGDLNQCRYNEYAQECISEQIRQYGTMQAVQAVHYLAENGEIGYISAYTRRETVGIASVEYPLRANINTGTLLVPTVGQPIDVDDISDLLNTFSSWQAFSIQHPDAIAWAPGVLSHVERTGSKLAFIFTYPIRICHACGDLATLAVSFQFTTEGKFVRKRGLSIY